MIRFRVTCLPTATSVAFQLRQPRKAVRGLPGLHCGKGPQFTATSPYSRRGAWPERSAAGPADAPQPPGIGDVLGTDDRWLFCQYWGSDASGWRDGHADKVAASGASGQERGKHKVRRANV